MPSKAETIAYVREKFGASYRISLAPYMAMLTEDERMREIRRAITHLKNRHRKGTPLRVFMDKASYGMMYRPARTVIVNHERFYHPPCFRLNGCPPENAMKFIEINKGKRGGHK